MSGHSSAGRSHCQNCGSRLSGPFCSKCGQHDVDYHRSIWPILEDSLEGLLHFDGKFFRTVRLLFTRPGFLTKEFISGRRVAYTQPLRLYIFASFIFFASGVAFNSSEPPPAGFTGAADAKSEGAGKPAAAASAPPANASKPSALGRVFEGLKRADPKEVSAEWRHLAPEMAVFCIPFLGVALMLAYRKSGRVYVEHLIFALHLQTFCLIAALATTAVRALLRLLNGPLSDLAGLLSFFVGWWLLFRAFREVYVESRWGTFFKMIGVAAIYGIILLIGISLTAIFAALLVAKG
jgi:hypothetical protein